MPPASTTPVGRILVPTLPVAATSSVSRVAAGVVSKQIWQQYTNYQLGFSIQYPCDSSPPPCAAKQLVDAFSSVTDDSGLVNDVWLPTPLEVIPGPDRDAAWVVLYTFRETEGGDPSGVSQWATTSLQAALKLPVNSRCALQFSDSTFAEEYFGFAGTSTFPCRVVSLSGQKAIKVINEPESTTLDATTDYYVNRGGELWLEISEYYAWDRADYNEAQRQSDDASFDSYLRGELTAPPAWIKQDVDATAEVLATLKFF